MAMLGYHIGLSGSRSMSMAFGISIAFSVVLLLIVSLDRPNGIIRVNQTPITNVSRYLHTHR
jgi:hypothetical protein